MEKFKYKTDRRTMAISIMMIILFIGIAIALLLLYTGGFFSAWFTSLIIALMALMILSVPRYVGIKEDSVEIHCVMDVTSIELREIASIRKVDRQQMRWIIPIFGAAGFFGYYGKFFDFKEFDAITIYASEWNNFVEIIDIYDYRTYVSCRDSDRFIESVLNAIEQYEQAAADSAQEIDN